MTWRKLLATFTALNGLLFVVAIWFSSISVPYSVDWFAQTALAGIGLLAAINSIFVWRGKYVTLWMLRLAVILVIPCVVVLAAVDYYSSNYVGFNAVSSLAFYAWIASIPSFFLLLLWHPQVVAEFRGRASEP